MARKIFRSGNSVVVSLPPDVLEAVGLDIGDKVAVVADTQGHRIIITPHPLPGVRPGLLDRVDRFIEDYRPTLESLARE